MKVAIASGKGGTGKTTVATNLAIAAAEAGVDVCLLDCDVEEPNDRLFFRVSDTQKTMVEVPVPVVDEAKCSLCGECARFCAYHAIAVTASKVLVFRNMCHGCGGCVYFCPKQAISEVPRQVGTVESTSVRGLHLVWGRSEIGSALTPWVIHAVRQSSGSAAQLTIVDGPPGTSCGSVAATKDNDMCLLVTEPTPFGLHDLKLAVAMVRDLGVTGAVIINRAGERDSEVDAFCQRESIPILMRIPFDRRLAECYAEGKLWVDEFPLWRSAFLELWNNISNLAE